MEKLRKLIKESLTNPPKKENCGCGGNCCKAPTLTEGKSSKLVSENLAYHIDNKIPLFETVFRIGSEKHFELIKEARRLYSRGIIEVSEDDKFIIKSNLGEFGMYEGEKVPLDLPMVNEEYDGMDIYDQIANEEFGMDYDQLGPNEQEWVRDEIDNMELNEKKKGIDGKECWDGYRYAGTEKGKDKCVKVNESKPNTDEVVSILKKLDKDAASMLFKAYKDKSLNAQQVIDIARKTGNINEARAPQTKEAIEAEIERIEKALEKIPPRQTAPGGGYYSSNSKEGKIDRRNSKKEQNYRDKLYTLNKKLKNLSVNEAEYQGKDVDLNKPKRGGSKKFYVYVRDPKTKKVKKVSFGAKDGGQNLKVKFKDPEARKAFADRHNCDQKKDKTTPGFWSCNIPRYADLLGLGSKMNTYW